MLHADKSQINKIIVILILWIGAFFVSSGNAAPPRLSIYHFDVNVGDATLILSPDGHAVLIDGGNYGRGKNPIAEFLNRAKNSGHLVSLDYVIVTHYDADHIAGLLGLFDAGWYPEILIYDRGDTLLPHFDRDYLEGKLSNEEINQAELMAFWGSAPCSKRASAALVKYMLSADGGGKRTTMKPGDVISLDHGIEITALVVNAADIDGGTVNVDFPGRRADCASNDLSIGLLLKYGNFQYLIAGDLTGNTSENVADIEELIKDDALNIDVYHVNHHGSQTSSSKDFLEAITPTVAIVSNGTSFGHPRKDVIENSILSLTNPPKIYLTNKPKDDDKAWQAPSESIADLDNKDYDGIVEIAVWKRTYRVFRWRDGGRIDKGDRFYIKN